MMRVLVALALIACRGAPTTVRYAGPAVGQCSSGRGYAPPSVTAQTQPFIAEEAAPDESPKTTAKKGVKSTPGSEP